MYLSQIVEEQYHTKLDDSCNGQGLLGSESIVLKVSYDLESTPEQREGMQELYDQHNILHFSPEGEMRYDHIVVSPDEGEPTSLNEVLAYENVTSLEFAGYENDTVGTQYVPSPHLFSAQTWGDWIKLVQIARIPVSDEARQEWQERAARSRAVLDSLFE